MKESKKVVAHLLYSFGRGGMENGVLKLVNSSNAERFRHVIVSLSSDVSLQNRLQGNNWRLYVIEETGLVGKMKALMAIVRSEQVGIVHARGWPTMLEGALLGLLVPGMRIVYSFHGRLVNDLSGISWKRKYLQIVLARCFDQVSTLTPSMKREIASEFRLAEARIKVVPNGIPEAQVTTPRRDVRNELGVGVHDVVVGYVGRLDPVKDISTVIHAVDKINRGELHCWLVIAGEGSEEAKLRALASQMANRGAILFTGFRENVFELMQAFDVYVQASLYEGLSNTILEAMSLGLPVICSDVGGNSDIIEPGENGYLFECGDAAALYGYLRSVLADEHVRGTIAVNNVHKVRSVYSIENMVKGYEGIYESM